MQVVDATPLGAVELDRSMRTGGQVYLMATRCCANRCCQRRSAVGDNPAKVHQRLAAMLDVVFNESAAIQLAARVEHATTVHSGR